jgi:two-component system response regulator QseB
MRILLVEDDQLLGDGVKTGLTQLGFVVDWLRDGESARVCLKQEQFEAVILDLGLPRLSGLGFLQAVRKSGNNIPIIILTARDSIDDRIKGLDSGADDYLTKPFDLNELGARVRALIRRNAGRADSVIQYKNLTLDQAAHTVYIDKTLLNLPRKEFSLLLKLLEHQGQVLSRDQLMQSLYGWNDDIDSNSLEVHIHNLRKKLGNNYIRTIRGVGYLIERTDIDKSES